MCEHGPKQECVRNGIADVSFLILSLPTVGFALLQNRSPLLPRCLLWRSVKCKQGLIIHQCLLYRLRLERYVVCAVGASEGREYIV